MPNPYFNEQLAQTHRRVLLQEAQREQLLAQLPTHHSLVQYITARLSTFLLATWMRLKRLALHREPVASMCIDRDERIHLPANVIHRFPPDER